MPLAKVFQRAGRRHFLDRGVGGRVALLDIAASPYREKEPALGVEGDLACEMPANGSQIWRLGNACGKRGRGKIAIGIGKAPDRPYIRHIQAASVKRHPMWLRKPRRESGDAFCLAVAVCIAQQRNPARIAISEKDVAVGRDSEPANAELGAETKMDTEKPGGTFGRKPGGAVSLRGSMSLGSVVRGAGRLFGDRL